MSFCPKCKGLIFVNKKKTSWRCKRSCEAGGILNPKGNISAQIQSQFPNPILKYQLKK